MFKALQGHDSNRQVSHTLGGTFTDRVEASKRRLIHKYLCRGAHLSYFIQLEEAWLKKTIRLDALQRGITSANFNEQVLQALTEIGREVNSRMVQMDMDNRYRSLILAFPEKFPVKKGFFGKSIPDWRPIYLELMQEMSRNAVKEIYNEIAASNFTSTSAYWTLAPNDRWVPAGPRPLTPTETMSPREAEIFVANLMRYLGAAGTIVTRSSQDGGLDAESDSFAVQVKHHSKPIGVATIREIYAVAAVRQKTPVIFSRSGFTSGALDFGITNDVLMFQYLPFLEGMTWASSYVLTGGLSTVPTKRSQNQKDFERQAKPSHRNPRSSEAYKSYLERQKRR